MLAHEVMPTFQKRCTFGMGLFLPALEGIGRGGDSSPGLIAAHIRNGAENPQAAGVDDIDRRFRTGILPDTAD